MNRRGKIIVSVTGIFIVLLILVGLTYAYFLTQIRGNENDKSISVTTANLALVYSDGTDIVLTSEDKLIPGQFTKSKTFTVENTGNATVENYAVVLEDFKVMYAETVGENIAGTITNLVFPETMEMTLTCTNKDGSSCTGTSGSLPTTNDILVMNSIEEKNIQTYELTLTYVDNGQDQSSDMNKTIEGKLNIIDGQNTIDLTGTVASVSDGDYVQVNSEPKVSPINKDKTYKVVGLEPGTHTIGVYSSTGTLKGSSTFTLNKSDEESVSGTTINFTDASRSATINIASDYTMSINSILESSEITLASAILRDNKVVEPLTTPGQEASAFKFKKAEDPTTFRFSKTSATNCSIAYASDYTIDESTGKFTLGTGENPVTITKYTYSDELANNLAGKYAYWSTTAITENDVVDLTSLYKITTTVGDITSTSIKYEYLSRDTESAENVLASTEDDYGTSYYFRGGVTNNYVEFNNMCWRIVRIEGDQSVKLTLAAQKKCKEITEDDTFSAFIGIGDYGYTDEERADYENSFNRTTSMKYKFNAFLNGGSFTSYDMEELSNGDFIEETITYPAWSDDIKSKLKTTTVCIRGNDKKYDEEGNEISDSEAVELGYWTNDNYKRLSIDKAPSLVCALNGERTSEVQIYPLTADEIVFAGVPISPCGVSGIGCYSSNYLKDNAEEFEWWTLSTASSYYNDVYNHDSVFGVLGDYLDGDIEVGIPSYDHFGLRPAISLKAGINILKGNGTKNEPYIIK